MKKIHIMIWMAGLLLTAGLFSCEMKDELKGDVGVIPSEVGYLDLSVAVGQGTRVEKATSAKSSVNTDDFPVVIKGTDVEYTKTFESYAKLQEESPIALPVGNYTVSAHTNAELKALMDVPYYAGETNLTIAKEVEAKANVECTMKNTKIQLIYDPEFSETFKEWDITISDGSSNILTYDETDLNPKAKYWLVADDVKVIEVRIEAVTQDGTPVSENRSYTKPDDADSDFWAGSDALTVTMEPGEPSDPENPYGVTGIKVTVQISFDDNELEEVVEIPVEGDDEATEPSEPDGGEEGGNTDNKPQIEGDYLESGIVYTISENPEWDGKDPTTQYVMDDAPSSAKINILSPNGFNFIKVKIVAGNEGFGTAIGIMHLDSDVDILDEGLDESLKQLLLPPGKDATEYSLDVATFFGMMNIYGATNPVHTFVISVEDSLGQQVSSSLSVKIVKK